MGERKRGEKGKGGYALTIRFQCIQTLGENAHLLGVYGDSLTESGFISGGIN